MARRAPVRRPSVRPEPEAAGGGLGGVLRGSMNSMIGTVGLNVPLRAVERLTTAVEHAASMLEGLEAGGGATRVLDLLKRADRIARSVERASRHLDRLDDDFVKRLNQTLDVLVEMRGDTAAIRKRMDALELEVRGVRTDVTERLDRLRLLRSNRRTRKATNTAAVEPE